MLMQRLVFYDYIPINLYFIILFYKNAFFFLKLLFEYVFILRDFVLSLKCLNIIS